MRELSLPTKLRKGNITQIESFDLLHFRMAMFHELMAKVCKDFAVFLPSLSNSLDRGNLAYFRARLSKHDVSNEENKIKKGQKNLLFYEICLFLHFFYKSKL
jgi:hypothetical protein